jgi:hypothetical protein
MNNDALKVLRDLVVTKALHDQLEVLLPLDPTAEERYRQMRDAAWKAARELIEKMDVHFVNRWRCPKCKSRNVQVSLPTWYYESMTHDMVPVEVDSEADISWWYCEDCEETDSGAPEDMTHIEDETTEENQG